MGVRQTLEQTFTQFSPKEKRIALYLLQESSTFNNISIQNLASTVGTSPATITRFCRKVGCESFVDLKIQLQTDSAKLEPQETAGNFETVANYYDQVLQRTAQLLSEKQIRDIIDLIVKAHRVFIYGVGSSGLTAREMAMRLSRMGLSATCETDSHMMIINSTIVKSNDLVIGISNSGETQEVIQALKKAKANGARIIGVTSMQGSPLSVLADTTLFVHNSKFVNNEQFVNTQFPIYFLFDIMTLMLLENTQYRHNMQKTIHEINQNQQNNQQT